MREELRRRWLDEGFWEEKLAEPQAKLLEAYAADRPNTEALFDGERRFTYRELSDAVQAFAAGLVDLGLEPGEPIVVNLPNWWEYVVAHLAVPLAGLVAVPMAPILSHDEVLTLADKLGSRTVIWPGRFRGVDVRDRLQRMDVMDRPPEFVIVARGPSPPGVIGFEELLHRGKRVRTGVDFEARRRSTLEVSSVSLTSGTTGLPKLVQTTPNNTGAVSRQFLERSGIGPQHVAMGMAPLQQGTGSAALIALALGSRVVFYERFTPEKILELIAGERVNALLGVPANLLKLLRCPSFDDYDLSSVERVAVAGAPLPPALAEEWERRSGSTVVQFYGAMDAGIATMTSVHDPPEIRHRSVGSSLEGIELQIVDDDNRPVPPGQVGEISMRGPTVQVGYVDADRNRDVFDDQGWAHLGDLGYLDEDGYLYVSGRKKDIIIRGGQNINPREVEDILIQHPSVAELAVVPIPDDELGERACAAIVPRTGTGLDLEEMRRFLNDRGVAKFKWPERIVSVEELPYAGAGKVQKFELVRQLKEQGLI